MESDEEPGEPAENRRNFLSLALHHVLLRVAWIFKTESVLMPAFVDIIAGAGWVRGCLPVLNRLAQSIPPLLMAETIRGRPLKRDFVALVTVLMGIPFLILAGIWWGTGGQGFPGLAALFLILYTIFFTFSGLQQSGFATLQGKLIPVTRRGRLMGAAGIVGSVGAITCAWFLLSRWLALPDGGFHWIFGFTGAGFVVAGLTVLAAHERRDEKEESPAARTGNVFRRAWVLFRSDLAFRRVAIVSMLLMSTQLLFPHYQALAKVRLDYEPTDLMLWVVTQNAGVGVISLFSGWIADRFGNRLALRLAALFTTGVPVLALAMTAGPTPVSSALFSLVFVGIAWVPVSMRLLTNYVLEITRPEHHPFYVGSLKLCFAVPFVLSPLVGALVDLAGFEGVFVGIAGLSLLAFLGSFRMLEPREPGFVQHDLV